MKFIALVALFTLVSACSTPPKPPRASGEWVPVNHASNVNRGV